ncbi:MAG: ribonuclease HII [Pseudomonadota bacterium]
MVTPRKVTGPPARGLPDFTFETRALAAGRMRVVGVDEVGRGPLAGPVTAAAVRLDPKRIPEGLNDSKRLSAKRRAVLAKELHASAEVSVVHVGVADIDRLNILGAAHLAMIRAVAGLGHGPDWALVDGIYLPKDLPCDGETVVRGDGKVASIAAASIVAKVARDALMAELAAQHPEYGWTQNAGYPTPAHLAALERHGVTPYHRSSFRPVHNILCRDTSVRS